MTHKWQSRRVALVIVVILASAGLLVVGSLPPREPLYQGKPLSYWLQGCIGTNPSSRSWRQSTDAVQAIGTNAIPTLLRLLQAQDSALQVTED